MDAWVQHPDGAWVRRHSEGPVRYTSDTALGRYLDIREENWNAQLIRQYRWTGSDWVQEQ